MSQDDLASKLRDELAANQARIDEERAEKQRAQERLATKNELIRTAAREVFEKVIMPKMTVFASEMSTGSVPSSHQPNQNVFVCECTKINLQVGTIRTVAATGNDNGSLAIEFRCELLKGFGLDPSTAQRLHSSEKKFPTDAVESSALPEWIDRQLLECAKAIQRKEQRA